MRWVRITTLATVCTDCQSPLPVFITIYAETEECFLLAGIVLGILNLDKSKFIQGMSIVHSHTDSTLSMRTTGLASR